MKGRRSYTFGVIALFCLQNIFSQKITFERDFAPQEGLVKSVEKPLRDELCLNGTWQFMPVELFEGITFEEIKSPELPPEDGWEEIPIKIPSPWNVNDFTNGNGGDFRAFPGYPKEWGKVRSGWLKKTTNVPADWKENRLNLHFEAVAGYAKVFINGKVAGEHFDAFLPFSFDVTDFAQAGEEMEVLVWVAHGSLFDEPGKYGFRTYVGGSFWGNFIVGIWQDVSLQKLPLVYITDTYIKPWVNKDELEVEVTIRNTTNKAQNIHLNGDVFKWINKTGTSTLEMPEINWELGEKCLTINGESDIINPNSDKVVILKTKVNGALDYWSPDNPSLYGLVLSVIGNSQPLDIDYTRFGWRQFDIQGKELFLNGEPIVIKGDSWHFTGVAQMTRRYAYAWYKMLKDANSNGVRLHAQVFPRFYLEMADEMGICVLDETGIWHSDGKPKIDSEIYWDACRKHVKNLVLRDRNYPSVFGWSVCNETLPVTRNVFNAPKELLVKNIEEINKWVAIAREFDPTRTWISGDGETPELEIGSPVKLNLPTVIGHYGPKIAYKYWSKHGKPWGIGETGMAYYGMPSQVAKINGDRAYESQSGRMEGLAAESFDLIVAQRKNKASYTSVFNLAWYALKPLELGLKDITRPPKLTDGIFFGEYVEGKQGYQPERLGPYSNTFNPGYDPSLPLYDPWPMFDAIKAAYANDFKGKQNIWKSKTDNTVKVAKSTKKQSLVWLSDKETSPAKVQFESIGMNAKPLKTSEKQLIIIDGDNPPLVIPDLIKKINSAMQGGSTVLVWHATGKSKDLIQSITQNKIEFLERNVTSYIIKNEHPIIRKENHASLYYSELTKEPVSTISIGGEWVQDANLILEACNTDWLRWNYNGEDVKTANVYRSEREAKNSGNIIVQQSFDKGELIVTTNDFFELGKVGRGKMRKMVKNLGGKLKGKIKDAPEAFNKKLELENVLFLGLFPLATADTNEVSGISKMSKKEIEDLKIGTYKMGKYWELKSAGKKNTFDFKKMDLDEKENGIVYLSFWMYSPRSLTDLLIEPDLPRLDMHLTLDHAITININGKEVKRFSRQETFNDKELTFEGFPLEKGWNHVLIKLVQTTGDWRFKMNFTSTEPKFLKKIETFVER